MRLLVLWLCLASTIAPLAWLSPAAAAPQVAASSAPFPLTQEGHVGGETDIIKVLGQTAYVGEGNHFTILDLRTFPQIRQQSSLPLPVRVEDIAVSGGMAYLALENMQIALVNIANPQQPVLVNTFPIGASGVIEDVEVAGTRLYVAVAQQGLQIYDVSNPAAPLLKGQYMAPIGGAAPARDLLLNGNVAYAIIKGGATPGVHVIDVSNLAAPALIRVIPPSQADAGITALVISDGRLYVGDNHNLRVFGLTTPTNPNLLGSSVGGVFNMAVANQRVYEPGLNYLEIFDVSTPSNRQYVGAQRLREPGKGIDMFGTTAFVVEGWYGLEAVDVSNPAEPRAIEHNHAGGVVWDMHVVGNLAYVGAANGLQIIDISDPNHPQIRSVFGKDVLGVKVVGGRAYISILPLTVNSESIPGLQVVDVRDPDHPVLLGSIEATDTPWRVEATGTRAYLVGRQGFKVFDVSDPANIQMINQVDFGALEDIIIKGDRVYAAGSGRILYSDLDGENEMEYMMDGYCYGNGLDVVGTTVYVAADSCGLLVLDLSNPYDENHWREVARLPIKAVDVKIVGAMALVSEFALGGTLTAVDISNPTQPTVRSRAALPAEGLDLEVSGDRAFIAGPLNGMQIFDTPLSYTFLPLTRQQ